MYYTLIASLEPYTLKTDTQSVNLLEVRSEVFENLSVKDRTEVELLYAFYDIENLLGQLTSSNIPHNPLGNLSAEQIAEEIAQSPQSDQERDEPFVSSLPVSVRYGLDLVKGRVVIEDEPALEYGLHDIEKLLLSNFYEACNNSRNKYLKIWAEIDREIREVVAGEVIAGDGDATEEWWWAQLQGVIKTEDFVEREHKMDELRWDIAQNLIEPMGIDGFSHEFDLSAVLSYLTKLNILQRWANLSKEIGRVRFEEMVGSFTAKGKIEL
ncbi:MAG: DUF2764 family protein [Rikenellaceae bacterium]